MPLIASTTADHHHAAPTPAGPAPRAQLDRREHHSSARLLISGRWCMDTSPPEPENLLDQIGQAQELRELSFDTSALTDWDSTLVVFIAAILRVCATRAIACEIEALPASLQALLELIQSASGAHATEPAAAPDTEQVRDPAQSAQASFLVPLGQDFMALASATGEIMRFFGEGALAVQRLMRGQSRFRSTDFWLIVQSAGADALPIVSLVCFLVGMILAYIGNQQLEPFGARIYIADLVGLAMVIQIGALITAIVLAGRTGAAFAAQIGAMQANEEIDALRTLGLEPIDFLVLPRMLALILMTPLLTIYANLFGILGGAFVGTTVAGLTVSEYFVATGTALALNHLVQGLISATVYGAIVAASGCLRGMQCGRSAAEVGRATTSAVVTAILFIVIAAAVLTVLFQAIGLS
ncbi:MlaE family ABC transporter permease [Rhabdochromatium marinum]|uniref:MlaE family ABC transporter permease n=1 Tax=Rhabdochromatium marinum TaxID=48729 RepID=UPI00190553E9|nr:ABC transporter permease [Rhabdochromatium marinum]MBK1650425.1 hypothetical protein [Rhabdochromatium marinum]